MKFSRFPTSVARRLRSFGRDQKGAAYITVAGSIVSLVAVIGVATDSSVAYMVNNRLSAALDAGLLAAAQETADLGDQDYGVRTLGSGGSLDDLQTAFERFFAANFPDGYMGTTQVRYSLAFDSATNTVDARATAVVPTSFMQVVDIDELEVSATADVVGSSGGMEVVLVLDVTGSMRGGTKIEDLRDAAESLLDTLYGHSEAEPVHTISNLFVGLVPYSTTVNINPAALDGVPSRNIGRVRNDIRNSGRADSPNNVTSIADPIAENYDLFGNARTAWLTDDGRARVANTNPPFDVEPWLGCVEAREGTASTYQSPNWSPVYQTPGGQNARHDTRIDATYEAQTTAYDITDQPPLATNDSMRFTPFIYPDHPIGNSYHMPLNGEPAGFAIQAEHGNFAFGPNLGCPNNAVIPLIQDRRVLVQAVRNLEPWHRGGTMTNVGLAWGWRVLSPRWPHSIYWREGAQEWNDGVQNHSLPLQYGMPGMRKVVVIMTDGVNQGYDGIRESGYLRNRHAWDDDVEAVIRADSTPLINRNGRTISAGADYTSFGRPGNDGVAGSGRLGTSNIDQARYVLDRRTLSLCRAMRRNGQIDIYTVTFGNLSNEVRGLFYQCASESENYFHAANGTELVEAFNAIGEDLSNIRLAR